MGKDLRFEIRYLEFFKNSYRLFVMSMSPVFGVDGAFFFEEDSNVV